MIEGFKQNDNENLAAMHSILQDIMVTGSVDIEKSEIEKLIDLATSGKMSTTDALHKVMKIKEGRQDYH